MSLDQHNPIVENAHVATYTFAASTMTVWGLHMGDLAAIVSTFAAVCGVALQVMSYLDRRARRKQVMSYLDSRAARRRGVETTDDGETN